jgi:MFS family permease
MADRAPGGHADEAGPTGDAPVRGGARGRLGTTFASLSERDFAWFFAGNLSFFIATQMQFVIRGYLTFELTDSAAAIGYVTAASALPMLLASPMGGVVADRLNKKRLLRVTQAAATATAGTIGVLVLTDLIEFWHLLIAGAASGLMFAFNMPARQAIVPQLVPRHKMMNAISLQMGGQNLTRVVAPAMAGGLVAPLGVGWVYILVAIFFSAPLISEWRLPDHGMTTVRRTSARAHEDFAEALRYIRRDGLMVRLLVLGLVFPLFAIPVYQILPVFAKEVFDAGAAGLGLLAASTGLGGVGGALLVAAMSRYEHKGRLMLLSGVWLGLLYIAFAGLDVLAPAALVLALGSVGGVVMQTTNNTVIQATVSEEVRGRVMAIVMMSFGLMPLGVIPLAYATDAFGAQTALAGSAVIMLALLLGLFLLSPSLRNLRVAAGAKAQLSPARAAQLVAEGKISEQRARELTRMDERPPVDLGRGGPARGGPVRD